MITYKLGVPNACYHAHNAGNYEQCGLIVNIHGGLMNGDMMNTMTGSTALAYSKRFAILLPSDTAVVDECVAIREL